MTTTRTDQWRLPKMRTLSQMRRRWVVAGMAAAAISLAACGSGPPVTSAAQKSAVNGILSPSSGSGGGSAADSGGTTVPTQPAAAITTTTDPTVTIPPAASTTVPTPTTTTTRPHYTTVPYVIGRPYQVAAGILKAQVLVPYSARLATWTQADACPDNHKGDGGGYGLITSEADSMGPLFADGSRSTVYQVPWNTTITLTFACG